MQGCSFLFPQGITNHLLEQIRYHLMQYAASMSNHLSMHSSDPEMVCSGAERFPSQILETLTLGSRYAAKVIAGH